MTHTLSLDGTWTLSAVDPDAASPAAALPTNITATVPGTVHTDLLAAGLIADPYLGLNEHVTDWIGHTTWQYAREFDWKPAGAERVELVFDGLDTVATVLLNGEVLASTANQNRTYRLDVTDRVTAGSNRVEVRFTSAWAYAAQVEAALGGLPNAYPTPFNFIRKMAANFGWDWGPQLVTAGIWRGVRLESWSGARLGSVRPTVGLDGANGTVDLAVDLDTAPSFAGGTLRVSVAGTVVEASVARGETAASVRLVLPNAKVWWPRGMGEQPLYDLEVWLADATAELDTYRRRIGFRTVALDTSSDEHGSAFTIVVNDVAVFVRGANWIPDDCFLPRVTRERYRERIEQAVDANLNLLRVWGGGIYESDDFYDICDELGVMTWQDFLFACAAYPEEEPIRGEVEAEARDNVERLMSHASLVLLNGANENIWGWFDWDWQEPIGDRTWGLGYYLEVLPAIVSAVSPATPYWAASPYSGTMDIHANDPSHGNMHIWDVWNKRDYTGYGDYAPRFVSEFGFQGPPTWATLTEGIEAAPTRWDSPELLLHQKADDGNGKLARGLEAHLPEPTDIDDWHYLTQLNQARAISYGIERFRSQRPVCMGTVVWQLNDCWPVTSWAAIDGYGRRKPLWYALRSSNAERLLTFQGEGSDARLVASNESSEPWRTTVSVSRRDFAGAVFASVEWQVEVAPRTVAELPVRELAAGVVDAASELLVAVPTEGPVVTHYFGEDKDLTLVDPELGIEVGAWKDGRVELTLTARQLARAVTILADRVHPDAWASEGPIDIIPGIPVTVTITSPVEVDPHLFGHRPALRTVNEVVGSRARLPV